MDKKQLNVGLVGYKFMGRAHSNAWINAPIFFNLEAQPVLKAVCGRNLANVNEFATNWNWQSTETDWKKLVQRNDIDIIDIALPQHMHYEIAIAAAKEGKHIFCEKPMAMTLKQAEEMLKVCVDNKVVHYLNHNYRRVPAIALAKKMITKGRIGKIYHLRAAYQQDWIVDPMFPLTWQLREETAAAGPQWDLNSHCVDLAHFLVGPIKEVTGMLGHFITERPVADEDSSGNLKADAAGTVMAKVTVEDAALMMVNFENGALGSFEATRFATGRKNKLSFEIYGSEGSIVFDLERMNELQCFFNKDENDVQGFRTIQTTDSQHPYMGHWWPAGHIIGYEHTFIHAVADFINAVVNGTPIRPDFSDGIKTLKVLEAGIKSAAEGKKISIN